jgi:pSer/pThr/pTyr-binding forkhead associated (FHA) protein
MSKLVVLTEGFTGRSCEIKGEKITIGRVEDNTFPIPEPSVSSHHCEIAVKGGEVLVKDLNSTNGTYINGETVTEGTLKPGQILRLGQVEIRLESGAAPEKKKLDQTIVLPQGVNRSDLEKGARAVAFGKDSPFAKKSNKVGLYFIVAAVVVGVIIIAFVVMAFMQMQSH